MTLRQPSPESAISATRNHIVARIPGDVFPNLGRFSPWVFRSLVSVCVFVATCGSGDAQERTPVPSPDQQKKIEKLLEETYDLASLTTSTKKQEAIKTLSAAAANPDLPGDECYVVLLTVIRLTRETGDMPRWLVSVNMLINRFDVAPRKEKARFLVEYLEGIRTASSLKPVAEEAIGTATAMAQAHDYAAALDLLAATDKTAKRLADKNSPKLLADARKAIDEQKADHEQQALARKTLLEKPDDPLSNQATGRWLAVYEEDWPRARVFLAKGSDEKWRSAAQAEISMSSDTDSQLAVADAWWEITKTVTGNAKVPLQRHTVGLYEMAAETTKSPIVKTRIAQRLKELGPIAKAAETRPVKPSPAPSSLDTANGELPRGEWIDLREPVKIPEHVLMGKWFRGDAGLVCEPSWHARFMPPVTARGSYELECEFTRTAKTGPIQITLPLDSNHFSIYLSGWDGLAHGLQLIDGHEARDLSTTTGAVTRPGVLKNGEPHQLQVRVIQEGVQVMVTATLDDKRIIAWKGPIGQLSCAGNMALPCMATMAVSAENCQVEIHKLRLRLKQDGKAYRLENDWQSPLNTSVAAPPKELAARCATWNGRKYFMSEKPMDFASAQRQAAMLKGRLLTVSTADEEEFVLKEFTGRNFWLSAWHRGESQDWCDERNRPLKYQAKWGPRQPDNLGGRETHAWVENRYPTEVGWHDAPPGATAHACIEWGEEYPGN